MNYEQFKSDLLKRLHIDFPIAESIQILSLTKNNGTTRDGLIILEEARNIAPTIYLDFFYSKFQQGLSFSNIYHELLEFYHQNKPRENISLSFFTNFNNIKNKIVFKLVNYEQNANLLSSIPHIPYLDLAIVFCCIIEMAPSFGIASILIHNSHLDYWNKKKEDLFSYAQQNSPKLLEAQIRSLNDVLDITDPDISLPELPFLILSNKHQLYGASCILYQDVLKEYAQKYNSDFYIIPSSIHEVILIPKSASHIPNHFNHLIQDVNQSHVAEDEILSDHAYIYTQAENKIYAL